jgi:very-short-patch-repair endonuclease
MQELPTGAGRRSLSTGSGTGLSLGAGSGEAGGMSSGPVRGHVRSTRYTRLSRGLHLPISQSGDREAELGAWRLLLPPSGCFTNVTAAGVYRWPLPALPSDTPVFAAIHDRENRPRRPGLRVSRHPAPPPRLTRQGLPVAAPAEVLLAAAADLALLDLLPLLDAARHARHCTGAELVAASRGRRGSKALRRALAHSDPRAESPWETLLRVFHAACDVPVVPQHEVRTADGGFVARGDLWLSGTRVLHEYDGGVHRDREQHRRDLARERALGLAGWTRRGYTAVDLLRRPQQILREADAALGRAHDPGRLEAWWELLEPSVLTASGRAQLRKRWRLR